MSDKQVTAILQEARRQGWTCTRAGKHWKLIPPGGLHAVDGHRPFMLPCSPSDGRWWQNNIALLRRYNISGGVLADSLDHRPGRQAGKPQPNDNEATWLDPLPLPEEPPDEQPAVRTLTPGIRLSVELIGPAEAKEMLGARWAQQRLLRPLKIASYAEDMANDRFTLGTDAIGFDVNDELINGQHRLHAVIQADAVIETIVVRGLPTVVYDALDTGMKRTMVDRLQALGEKDCGYISAALVKLSHYSTSQTLVSYRSGATIPQLLAFFAEHPRLRDIPPKAGLIYRRFRFSAAYLTALFYLFYEISPTDADVFIETLVSGKAEQGDPVLVLREAMFKRLATPVEKRYDDIVYAAYFVKTWNALTSGSQIGVLRWGSNENFPLLFDPDDKLADLFGWDR